MLQRFAPLDIPYAPNVHDLQALFSHFKVPAEFIDERLRSVTHSFGWHQDRDSSYGEASLEMPETEISHVLLQFAGSIFCAKMSNLFVTNMMSPPYAIHEIRLVLL